MKKTILNFSVGLLASVLAIATYHFSISEKQVPVVTHVLRDTPTQLVSTSDRLYSVPDFQDAAESSLDAVVHISNQFTVENYYYDPLRDLLHGDGRFKELEQGYSSGSGVIISEDGYIVTNNHVVEDADELVVTLNDNRQYTATIIGSDPGTDLALIKIDTDNLHYINMGNSEDVRVGQWVLAIGNPMNLTSTVTAGIVSAKARNINLLYDPKGNYIPLESFIQTDAAVNPGNSGGALINDRGELIGINTAIASTTGAFSGYSFAVPVNIVKKVALDIIEYGEVKRAFIGVTIQDVTQSVAEMAGLDDIEGVYVAGLMDGGAAMEAGIAVGDVITKVGGTMVTSVPQLQELIGIHRPGDSIMLTVKRDGKTELVNVILRDENGKTSIDETSNKPSVRGRS